MNKELSFFSFENNSELKEFTGGGKNLDDNNNKNKNITKEYRKKLLELNDKYISVIASLT